MSNAPLRRAARRVRRPLLAVAVVFAATTAFAAPSAFSAALDGNTITSPSGFNHCHWYSTIPYSATYEPGVVCTSTRGRESGYAVVLTSSGRRWTGYAAHRWLFGAGPRLSYGYSSQRFGIVCLSLTTGLRCTQRSTGHGIFVNTNVHGFFSSYNPGVIIPQ